MENLSSGLEVGALYQRPTQKSASDYPHDVTQTKQSTRPTPVSASTLLDRRLIQKLWATDAPLVYGFSIHSIGSKIDSIRKAAKAKLGKRFSIHSIGSKIDSNEASGSRADSAVSVSTLLDRRLIHACIFEVAYMLGKFQYPLYWIED